MKKIYLPLFLGLAFLGSCKKDLVSKYNETSGTTDGSSVNVSSMQDLKVPAGFNWSTTKTYNLEISLKSIDDKAVKNVAVKLMSDSYENKGDLLLKAGTDENGTFKTQITLPAGMKQLVLNSSYLGLPKDIIVDLTSSNIKMQIGGSASAPIKTVESKLPSNVVLGKSGGSKFNVVPSSRTWNSSGVPNYKEATDDVVSQSLLADINGALPESVVLSSSSPMLSESAVRVIRVKELADVYVTFVSEGAGYRNTLFYYTYNENDGAPESKSDIDKYTVIFPNTSLNGSGGGLNPGNKVFLGRFPAGTVIGYGVAADGWKGGTSGFNGVTEGNWLVFGQKDLNPESNNNLKQHMVLLNDIANHRFIMGFEDIRRDNNGCDHDFNDVLFYTTSNPVTAIDDEDVTPLPVCEDEDDDGVKDADDDYPTDPNKAFNNPTGTGSIAFEDQWPSTGDYDLNDV
ncbi:MAG: LruC domain-containing protein, partial [Bacteroidia bacterium]